MKHITKWSNFLVEFVETPKNTPLLYKDDNIEVKVSKTFKSSREQNRNTSWCSSAPGPFYAHNRTSDMFRINFPDGYKLRLTWDFIEQRASELGSYSGGTHWGQGGVVDGERQFYDVLRPRDNEDPFSIDWTSDKKREIVDRIKMIPDEAKLAMMEYHDKSSREKSEVLKDLYRQIEKIKVVGVKPIVDEHSYYNNSAEITVKYLDNNYTIRVNWNDKKSVSIELSELDGKLKNKYAKFGRELSGYIYDKMMEFTKKNKIDLKINESLEIGSMTEGKLFSEINHAIWDDLIYSAGIEEQIDSVSELDVKFVRNEFSRFTGIKDVHTSKRYHSDNIESCINLDFDNNNWSIFYKFKDEWWACELYISESHNNGTFEYYVCDGYDGIKALTNYIESEKEL